MADAQRAILEQSGDIVEKNFAAREALAGLLGVSEDALLKQVEQLRLTKQLQAKGIELDLTLENDKLLDAIEIQRDKIEAGDKETAKLLDSFAETADQRTTEELLLEIIDVLKTTPVTTAFDTPGDIQKNIQDASKAVLDVETALKDALTTITTGVTQAQLQVAGGVGLGVDAIQLVASTIKQGFKGLFDDNAFNNSTFRTDILNVSADSMQKRALGGPVASGIPYIVGEVGPEVFVPSENGTIIPNNQLAASGGSPISVDIDYNVRSKKNQLATTIKIKLITNKNNRRLFNFLGVKDSLYSSDSAQHYHDVLILKEHLRWFKEDIDNPYMN